MTFPSRSKRSAFWSGAVKIPVPGSLNLPIISKGDPKPNSLAANGASISNRMARQLENSQQHPEIPRCDRKSRRPPVKSGSRAGHFRKPSIPSPSSARPAATARKAFPIGASQSATVPAPPATVGNTVSSNPPGVPPSQTTPAFLAQMIAPDRPSRNRHSSRRIFLEALEQESTSWKSAWRSPSNGSNRYWRHPSGQQWSEVRARPRWGHN